MNSSEMQIPNVLIANQSSEESQSTELNTVRLNSQIVSLIILYILSYLNSDTS